MYNIDLNEIELEKLIEKLDNYNKTIIDSMEYIYNTMTKIDEKDWYSSEKERINNNFIPYLKEQENITNDELFAKTKILKDALALYRKRNQSLAKETVQLEVLK